MTHNDARFGRSAIGPPHAELASRHAMDQRGTGRSGVCAHGLFERPVRPRQRVRGRIPCEGFVDKRLKAPATADYDLSATKSGGKWEVVGTVDSENSFGAKIR